MFNIRNGISRKDDIISGRYMKEAVEVEGRKVQLTGRELNLMVEEIIGLESGTKMEYLHLRLSRNWA